MTSVPAFTSAPGLHTRTGLVQYGYRGYYDDGTPGVDLNYSTYLSDKVYKQPSNRDPWRMPGYLKNKTYSRSVVRVTKCEPAVRLQYADSGYRFEFFEPIFGSFEPRKPGDYNEQGQHTDATSRTKALNKLRGERTLQLGADLGEARKTVNMIATPFGQLLRAYSAGRRGQWNKIPHILGMSKRDVLTGKYAANKWLEYQYGWLPLMGTVYDGTEILREGFDFPSTSRCASVRGGHTYSWEHEFDEGGQEGKSSGWIRVVHGITFKVKDATVASLDAAGVLNPASIAWELVPFSFVLDWFIPVGNVLSALTASAGLEFVDGFRSEVRFSRESAHRKHFEYHTGGGTVNKLIIPGQWSSEEFHFFRNGLRSFPLPALYTNPEPFTTKRTRNALALLRQLL